MNVHVPHPSARAAVLRGELREFATSAHNHSRRAVSYAQWAAEAELQGKIETYRKYRDLSQQQRSNANWLLDRARLRQAELDVLTLPEILRCPACGRFNCETNHALD